MGTIGKRILTVAIALLLVAGVPYFAATTLHAGPGSGSECKGPCGEKYGCGHECGHQERCGPGCPQCGECPGCTGCGCESGCPKAAAQGVPPCMQDNAAAVPGGIPRMMRGGGAPPMRKAMGMHMEEIRGTILKLRELEGKMEALKSKDDAAGFRAASLEHAKLLTDLQESHLKQMEGMMGGK